MICPLCEAQPPVILFTNKDGRSYFECGSCGLAFADPKTQIPVTLERERYSQHQNFLAQNGYRQFLNKMWLPLKEQLKPGMKGLDFGSGPTTAFAELALESGYIVDSYDPYFARDENLLTKKYDFVWCSEVFEHFNLPRKEIELLESLLAPSAILAVMTSPYLGKDHFPKWHYHKDSTHVSFYSEKTMRWIAQKMNWQHHQIKPEVTIFRRLSP